MPIPGGYYDAITSNSTEYNSILGGDTWNTTEAECAQLWKVSGSITYFGVELVSSVAGGDTALTFDISDTNKTGNISKVMGITW
jgi:hypothetical protein